MCGMRRPSTGSNDGDMSRQALTSPQNGSINSIQTIINNETNISGDTNNNLNEKNAERNNKNNECLQIDKLIDTSDQQEWQNCRKRKERQDSTSSMTQDRKLVRSSSEEIITQNQEVIRRVSSHEDFKKPLPLQSHNITSDNICEITEEVTKSSSNIEQENIPTQQSNNKVPCKTNGSLKDVQLELENDHEDRRNKERFWNLKGRTSGRKSPGSKKSKKSSRRDFIRSEHVTVKSCLNVDKQTSSDELALVEVIENTVDSSSDYDKPWYNSLTEYTPVPCERFADATYDHSVNYNLHEKHAKSGYHYEKYEKYIHLDCKNSFKNFLNAENTKTRELMQRKFSTDSLFQSPDDRVKQINKRLITLKKKITVYEEQFESNHGYRPSHADKANDKSVKSYLSEINRLRKEKSEIKTDPLSGIQLSQQNESAAKEKRIGKLKDTMLEIEKRLNSKRVEENRDESIELMKAGDLIQEKTSVQKALLYLESIFGRPGTKEERDIARPLYDRYRVLKRLVKRNNSLSGPSGGQELPTILEHEALAFPTSTTPSTDISPPSTNTSVLQSPSSEDTSTSTSIDATSSVTENFKLHSMSIEQLWIHYDTVKEEKKQLRRVIKEFEHNFEEKNFRKMLKSDRKAIEDTYDLYKQKKAKLRLLDALLKKQISK